MSKITISFCSCLKTLRAISAGQKDQRTISLGQLAQTNVLRCGLSSLQEVEKYSRSGKGLGGKVFTKARDVSEY